MSDMPDFTGWTEEGIAQYYIEQADDERERPDRFTEGAKKVLEGQVTSSIDKPDFFKRFNIVLEGAVLQYSPRQDYDYDAIKKHLLSKETLDRLEVYPENRQKLKFFFQSKDSKRRK